MVFILKLEKIGEELGIVLPEAMLEYLQAKVGREIFAIETPAGYLISRLRPEVHEQITVGEGYMDRYRAVMDELEQPTNSPHREDPA